MRILILLEYSETRNLGAAEKSETTDFGNGNFLIKLVLQTIYSNKEGNDAGISQYFKLTAGNVGENSCEEKLTDGYYSRYSVHLLNYCTQNFLSDVKVSI